MPLSPKQQTPSATFCKTDTVLLSSQPDSCEPVECNSESADNTEIVSELDHPVDGSFAQYHGHVYEARHCPSNHDENAYDTDQEIPEGVVQIDEDPQEKPHSNNHNLDPTRHSAMTNNSFDQVAEEIADDLDVFQQVEDHELNNLAELIPERNQDRLFSQADHNLQPPQQSVPPSQPSQEHRQQASQHQHHPEVREEFHERHHVQEEHHEIHYQHQSPPHDEHPPAEEPCPEVLPQTQRDPNYISNASDLLSQAAESEITLPGPPPSFTYRGERLSRNVGDAMAYIWDKFWSEDVRQIVRIIRNRFSQIMPYIRRFLAHIVAFWGGITYIRRAVGAFIRLLKRDERVRELLERVGWASATTLRVFLSMCAMVMQAMLQFYHLMRERVIPDTRRVIPILYYKAIVQLIAVSKYSPWSLIFGPFSLTFAIDEAKIPDCYLLHDYLSIDREDVAFASMQDLMHTVRESVYRTRYPGSMTQAAAQEEEHKQSQPLNHSHDHEHAEHREMNEIEEDCGCDETTQARENEPTLTCGCAEVTTCGCGATHDYNTYNQEGIHGEDVPQSMTASTPVHTQSTDETPVPPPPGYTGPKYLGSKNRMRRMSNGPLSERTNLDDDEL